MQTFELTFVEIKCVFNVCALLVPEIEGFTKLSFFALLAFFLVEKRSAKSTRSDLAKARSFFSPNNRGLNLQQRFETRKPLGYFFQKNAKK
jgi:hypothetical protein